MKIGNINNYSIQNKYPLKFSSFMGAKRYRESNEQNADVFILSKKTYEMSDKEAQSGIINIVLDSIDRKAQELTPRENSKIYKEGKKLLKEGRNVDYNNCLISAGKGNPPRMLAFDKFDERTGKPKRVLITSFYNPSVVYKCWDFDDKKTGGLKYSEFGENKTTKRKYDSLGNCYAYIEDEFGGKRQDIFTGNNSYLDPKKGYNFIRLRIDEIDGEKCQTPVIRAYVRPNSRETRYIEYDKNNAAITYKKSGKMWNSI